MTRRAVRREPAPTRNGPRPGGTMVKKAWFLVVNEGRGRLLSCGRVLPGRIGVDEHDAIENRAEEHEHGRPSPRAGKSGNTYASGGHENAYQRRRFAKEVVAWLEKKLDQLDIESVTLIAAPRFLGELRKLCGPALAKRIREKQGDLTQLSAAGLAKHPAVIEIAPPERAAR
jgi:protein required for attachment to host cells